MESFWYLQRLSNILFSWKRLVRVDQTKTNKKSMAAFIVGKSLKDRRQAKAMAECFDLADKNGNGKISVAQYTRIFRYVVYSLYFWYCMLMCGCFWNMIKWKLGYFITWQWQRNVLSSSNSVPSEHGVSIDPQELAKLYGSTDSDVQVTKEEFMRYAKRSEFFKNQLGKVFFNLINIAWVLILIICDTSLVLHL